MRDSEAVEFVSKLPSRSEEVAENLRKGCGTAIGLLHIPTLLHIFSFDILNHT